MFGMMLELVYVRRAQTGNFRGVAAQLIRRSAQCYLAYVCTAVAGWVGGILTFKGTVTASLMITDAYFGNVLKWYTFGLLLAIPLLYLRLRVSIWSVTALSAATWSLASLPWELWLTVPDQLHNVAGVLIGFNHQYGPSVFHGLVFVALGMLLSNMLRRANGNTAFYLLCGGLLVLVGLTFSLLSWPLPFIDVLQQAVGDTWRQQNHIGYFALGVGLAVLTLVTLAVLMRKNKPLPAWSQFPLRFGTSSLMAFTVGNVLLNVRPRHMEIETFSDACLYSMIMLTITLVVLHLTPRLGAVISRPSRSWTWLHRKLRSDRAI
jgi:hypothetical protein